MKKNKFTEETVAGWVDQVDLSKKNFPFKPASFKGLKKTNWDEFYGEKVKDEWKPVFRYDCSHNISHIDRYNLRGEKIKEEICLSYEESLTLADEDINMNWELYMKKFLEGEYP